jgi:hypothetical protein
MNANKFQSILTVVVMLLLSVLAWFLFIHFGRGDQGARPQRRQAVAIYEGLARPQQAVSAPPEDATNIFPVRGDLDFDDGLRNPVSREQFVLEEFEVGVSLAEIYVVETGGQRVRITKTRHENGTPHFHYEYRIELAAGDNFRDITPDGFRTIEGADCSLQKLRFTFIPALRVTKISRPWQDTWISPTTANRTVYSLDGGQLRPSAPVQLEKVCDVSGLF